MAHDNLWGGDTKLRNICGVIHNIQKFQGLKLIYGNRNEKVVRITNVIHRRI